MADDAKQTIDDQIDSFVEGQGKAQTDSSTVEKTEVKETSQATSETDSAKTDKVAQVEADETLDAEAKLAKIAEILGDDQKAIDAYIKQKGYHKDPAWQKLQQRLKEAQGKSSLSEVEKGQLEEFKQLVNSPEFIRASMEKQGYKPEAIDSVLREKGFEVAEKPDDTMGLIFSKLGIKEEDVEPQTKAIVKDIASIFDILLEDRFGKKIPKEIEPIKQFIESSSKRDNANKLTSQMEKIISDEGILDWKNDIEPELNRFMDENEEKFKSGEMVQQDVYNYFIYLNHRLGIERLKTGKRKEERDGLKNQNRPAGKGERPFTEMPKTTGDFDKDLDSAVYAMGLT